MDSVGKEVCEAEVEAAVGVGVGVEVESKAGSSEVFSVFVSIFPCCPSIGPFCVNELRGVGWVKRDEWAFEKEVSWRK